MKLAKMKFNSYNVRIHAGLKLYKFHYLFFKSWKLERNLKYFSKPLLHEWYTYREILRNTNKILLSIAISKRFIQQGSTLYTDPILNLPNRHALINATKIKTDLFVSTFETLDRIFTYNITHRPVRHKTLS